MKTFQEHMFKFLLAQFMFYNSNFILIYKEIGHEEPYYSTKISIFSFGGAALRKASTI